MRLPHNTQMGPTLLSLPEAQIDLGFSQALEWGLCWLLDIGRLLWRLITITEFGKSDCLSSSPYLSMNSGSGCLNYLFWTLKCFSPFFHRQHTLNISIKVTSLFIIVRHSELFGVGDTISYKIIVSNNKYP